MSVKCNSNEFHVNCLFFTRTLTKFIVYPTGRSLVNTGLEIKFTPVIKISPYL